MAKVDIVVKPLRLNGKDQLKFIPQTSRGKEWCKHMFDGVLFTGKEVLGYTINVVIGSELVWVAMSDAIRIEHLATT